MVPSEGAPLGAPPPPPPPLPARASRAGKREPAFGVLEPRRGRGRAALVPNSCNYHVQIELYTIMRVGFANTFMRERALLA